MSKCTFECNLCPRELWYYGPYTHCCFYALMNYGIMAHIPTVAFHTFSMQQVQRCSCRCVYTTPCSSLGYCWLKPSVYMHAHPYSTVCVLNALVSGVTKYKRNNHLNKRHLLTRKTKLNGRACTRMLH